MGGALGNLRRHTPTGQTKKGGRGEGVGDLSWLGGTTLLGLSLCPCDQYEMRFSLAPLLTGRTMDAGGAVMRALIDKSKGGRDARGCRGPTGPESRKPLFFFPFDYATRAGRARIA